MVQRLDFLATLPEWAGRLSTPVTYMFIGLDIPKWRNGLRTPSMITIELCTLSLHSCTLSSRSPTLHSCAKSLHSCALSLHSCALSLSKGAGLSLLGITILIITEITMSPKDSWTWLST